MTLMTLFCTLLLGAAGAQGLEVGERPEVKPLLPGEPTGFGAGVVLGEPSGLALSQRLGTVGLIQAGAGYDFSDQRLHISADYVQNYAILESDSTPYMRYALSVGVGGRLLVDSGTNFNEGLGVRFPVGFTLLPRESALDVYIELAPTLLLIPSIDAIVEGGLGVRVYPGGLRKGG